MCSSDLVTNYLRERFDKDKIYLIGHSWGSLIGLKTIKNAPELYHAYIGMAQISNQLLSEKIAYSYMLEQYKLNGNKKMVRKFEKHNMLSLDYMPMKYVKFRDKPMHELGIGTMRDMKSVINGIFFPVMNFSEYTFSEKLKLWKANSMLLKKTNLWDTMIQCNLFDEIKTVEIPIYFLHGIYDYTVNYSLAKEYYQQITAPMKGFYTFEKSAHSPIFEEPDKFIKILREDVLFGKNELSDRDI